METLATVQGQIQRHLSTSSLQKITQEFRALECNAARVYFAYNLLRDLELFPEIVRVEKCDVKSEERRAYGNHLYIKQKNYSDALRHYNKAAAYAETDACLALALGNRSAVYFENKMYDYCLKDIAAALELKPPEGVVSKLLERQRKAREEQQLERDEYFTVIPEIPQKHSAIQCARNTVDIQSSDTLGRHVTASCDIHPGDVIAVEPPYTTVLLYDFYLTHCHDCLQPAHNLMPCVMCPLTLYCSEKCRQNAWNTYHQYECGILDTLHNIKATKLQLLALRVVLKLGPQEEELDYPLHNVYTSAQYPEIHHLITNEERRPISDLFARATVAATFIYLLETTGFIQGEGVRKNTALLLLKHLQTAPSNMHEISELQGRANTGYEITEIGAGAYAFLSLLNHSCCPNVVRHCHGSVMVLRAVKTIRAGEQLFDNYGYHFALMEKTERKTHLKEQYLFDCDCEACVNDYPLYADLSRGHNNFVCEENDLNELLCAKRSAALKLLPMTLKNAREFEENPEEHRVEILDNQEIMKQCFAILGNKNTLC